MDSTALTLLLVLVGVIALVVVALRRRNAVKTQWPRVSGTIAALELGERETSSGATDYFPMLTVSYQVGGTSYQASRIPVAALSSFKREDVLATARQKYKEGSAVALAYDPQSPQRVALV